MHNLDETDLRILRALQSDGSLTTQEVAERAGISQSPCSRRIIQMQRAGVIMGKTIELDRRKLGFDLVVDARVKLKNHDRASLEALKDAVRVIPEIQMAALVLGEYDFRLRLVARDIEHYQTIVQEKLAMLPGVQEIQSSVILEVVKNTSALPL
ncbi:MAG: Lrp/AsnC family transcriptional regulator [Pseudomonadota bacterium]